MPTTILAIDNQEDPIVNNRLKSLRLGHLTVVLLYLYKIAILPF